jgi:predicted transcriptional regulator
MADKPTSFRLSDETRELLAARAEELGISQSAVIELAVREFSHRRDLPAQLAGLRMVVSAIKKAGLA